jgi:hypothetical protein
MTLVQLQICTIIVIAIIKLWTKGLGVTHPTECSVALELPLSLISSSSNISPSCGVICILFCFLLSFTIFMCCYQHNWHCFTPTTFPFCGISLAFYFVFCPVTWLLAMKYGFCLQGRGRKVRQQFTSKLCVTFRALQIPQRSKPRCKLSVHWSSQIKIRQFPVIWAQRTEKSCFWQPQNSRNFSRILQILRYHNHIMYFVKISLS